MNRFLAITLLCSLSSAASGSLCPPYPLEPEFKEKIKYVKIDKECEIKEDEIEIKELIEERQ